MFGHPHFWADLLHLSRNLGLLDRSVMSEKSWQILESKASSSLRVCLPHKLYSTYSNVSKVESRLFIRYYPYPISILNK